MCLYSYHIRFVHLPLATLAGRFVEKLGAAARRVDDKFASAKGLSDLSLLRPHLRRPDTRADDTHWGWADWDLLIGDLPAVVGEDALWEYDADVSGRDARLRVGGPALHLSQPCRELHALPRGR